MQMGYNPHIRFHDANARSREKKCYSSAGIAEAVSLGGTLSLEEGRVRQTLQTL